MPLPDPTPELEDTNPDDEFYSVRSQFHNWITPILFDDDDWLQIICNAMRAIDA